MAYTLLVAPAAAYIVCLVPAISEADGAAGFLNPCIEHTSVGVHTLSGLGTILMILAMVSLSCAAADIQSIIESRRKRP